MMKKRHILYYQGALRQWHLNKIRHGERGANIFAILFPSALILFTIILLIMGIKESQIIPGLSEMTWGFLIFVILAAFYLFWERQFVLSTEVFPLLDTEDQKKWIRRAFYITLTLLLITIVSFVFFVTQANANEHRMVHITPLGSDHYTAEEVISFTVHNDRGADLYTYPRLRSVRAQKSYFLNLDSSHNQNHAIATQDTLHEGANEYNFIPVRITGADVLSDSSERWYIDVSFTHLDRTQQYYSDTFKITIEK